MRGGHPEPNQIFICMDMLRSTGQRLRTQYIQVRYRICGAKCANHFEDGVRVNKCKYNFETIEKNKFRKQIDKLFSLIWKVGDPVPLKESIFASWHQIQIILEPKLYIVTLNRG
jgi:hypothetical protein